MNNSFALKRYTLLGWSFFILTWISLCVDGLALDRSDFKINPDPSGFTFAPEDSLSTIRVPDGYKLELVAAEPMIEEPVCMAWGPNGELYVAEMRTYMRDIDMNGELEPLSRIVKLVDLDGDGRMDKSTTYLDNLVLPRAILTLDNKVLVGEPPHLWLCEDTDGDGVADKKISIFENFGKRESGNVEHKINGLQWTMDNWIYNTKSASIFRYRDGTIEEREERSFLDNGAKP